MRHIYSLPQSEVGDPRMLLADVRALFSNQHLLPIRSQWSSDSDSTASSLSAFEMTVANSPLDWPCPACTFENGPGSEACAVCETAKPASI